MEFCVVNFHTLTQLMSLTSCDNLSVGSPVFFYEYVAHLVDSGTFVSSILILKTLSLTLFCCIT